MIVKDRECWRTQAQRLLAAVEKLSLEWNRIEWTNTFSFIIYALKIHLGANETLARYQQS